MKKKSNGGFILAETIAVSTVVLGALVLIFTQFVTISKGYNNSFTYNNVDKLYSVSNVRDYILNDGFEELALALESEPYINITNCPTNYIVEYHYCEMLMDTLKVKDVLITKANMEDIKEADLSSFSQGMRNFIKILPGEEEGYRLIAEFDDENYATLLINDKITNLPNVGKARSYTINYYSGSSLIYSETIHLNSGETGKEYAVLNYFPSQEIRCSQITDKDGKTIESNITLIGNIDLFVGGCRHSGGSN